MNEAVILAGGLGTRLRSEVNQVPKSMAPIFGKPFLRWQLDYLKSFGIQKVVLAVGYLSDVIVQYFGTEYDGISIQYAYEKEPLGTGGAIKQALELTTSETVLILNGDTMFRLDLNKMFAFHTENKADFSLALKPMNNFERYGVVDFDSNHNVTGFQEKQKQTKGNINGGVYLLNKSIFTQQQFPEKFSFEKEFLEKKYTEYKFKAYLDNGYFLDIGIPKDYHQAQYDFKTFTNFKINKNWTLFLDRDGVINEHIKDGYVTSLDNFNFIEGSLEAISILSQKFNRIVVVTNQQCVGKGIITEKELNIIHQHLLQKVEENNGKIDHIYFAPQLVSENSIFRKPNTGMAEQAQNDFPEIDFKRSVMVGDSISDMEFGEKKGMYTVFIHPLGKSKYNFNFDSLITFAKSI